MITSEEQRMILGKTGMFYFGVKKDFCGKVDKVEFFQSPGMIINRFGYYCQDSQTWIAFVTDNERGTTILRKKLPSEEKTLDYLFELSESHNFAHHSQRTIDSLEDKKNIILSYLQKNYGYSEEKAQNALEYLLQVKVITFEFLYFIENGDYVPDKFASNFSGYTAKRLGVETELTILGGFNYMVYLKRKPKEALENLKKGLPRRKVFSEAELKNLTEK